MSKKPAFNKHQSERLIQKLSHAIAYHALDALKPAERNPRTHSRKQIRQIADSFSRFGVITPLIIDAENRIVAGHGRWAAAKQLGIDSMPCIQVTHLSKADLKALAIADNRIALNAGWDEELLALELQEIKALDPGLDLAVTGIEDAEIEVLIDGLAPEEDGNPVDDELPPVEPGAAVTRPGDVWLLGQHRLICGDALDPAVCETLMAGEKARMAFTDPPYNVPVDGHVSGLGKTRHAEFAMASGEMSPAAFTAFLTKALCNTASCCLDGAIVFACTDWRHLEEMCIAGRRAFNSLKNLIVWAKDNGGMGSFYRSRHELIYCFKVGTAPHLNTFGLGQNGRYRSNLWRYRGQNSFGAGRDAALAMHPTVKPVAMIKDAIRDVSKRGDIVVDLFGGSGSTMIAAHRTGRRGYLCEIDPGYCDSAIRRWETIASDEATLEATGQTFEEVLTERRGGNGT